MRQEYINRIRKSLQDNKDIVCGDDGFYIYWPTKQCGALSEHDLRIIADYLKELNDPWQKQIEEAFKQQEKNNANEINF